MRASSLKNARPRLIMAFTFLTCLSFVSLYIIKSIFFTILDSQEDVHVILPRFSYTNNFFEVLADLPCEKFKTCEECYENPCFWAKSGCNPECSEPTFEHCASNVIRDSESFRK